jgi:polyhydroxybutyrate depolymerase
MKVRHAVMVVPLFLGVAAISGYLVSAPLDDARQKMVVDGRERTYDVHVPSGYDGTKAVPLVMALHGRLGTGSGQEKLGHLDKVSDEHGFLVVYPDGLERSWADGRGGTPSDKNGVDDVKFLSALIDKMEGEYKVDARRVYAMGMSNGGFMSAKLACELSERIEAVAIVAASLSENAAASCHLAKPVSVMIIQGTQDPLVPLAGGELGKRGSGGTVLSHEATILRFVELNACKGTPKKDHIADLTGDGTTLDVTTYSPCAGGSEVIGYVVNDGGHTWPGGLPYLPAAMIGKTSKNLNASEVIWKFFESHAR